jgi:hypothetical protein
MVYTSSVPTFGPHARPSLEEDFLMRYPPSCIANLVETKKDGIYIVGGVVEGLVDPDDWWYASCSCHSILSTNSGGYYCHDCLKPASQMIPRFVLKP